MTLEGTITCTGLTGNITAVHVHDVTKSYAIVYNTGSPLADIMITVGADPTAPISYKAVLTKTDSIDAICNDQCYWNVHTTYEGNGEVRANMVDMRAHCNIDKYADDGTVTVYGVAPTTGLPVPDFCGTVRGFAVKGTGNCKFTVCWDQAASTVTFSGVCYGFTSDVYGIDVYFPDDSSYFLYLASYRFPTDCPFSFRYSSIDDFDLAKIISKRSWILIDSYDGTEQVQVDLTSSTDYQDYYTGDDVCVPYVTGLPEKALTCLSGTNDYNIEYELSSTDYLCSIYDYAGTDTLSYNSWSSCYICTCGADLEKTLPVGGSVCCATDNCNKGDADDLYCIFGAGGSMLSGGLMVALFAALITIWFN
jgi:hypothetical protein